eukprot:g75724.t1
MESLIPKTSEVMSLRNEEEEENQKAIYGKYFDFCMCKNKEGQARCSKKRFIIGSVVGLLVTGGIVAAIVLTLGKPANLPLVRPPVQDSTPPGLQTTGNRRLKRVVQQGDDLISQVKSRFFTDDGPVNIFDILADVDSRIAGINSRNNLPCLVNAPLTLSLDDFTQTTKVDFRVQCSDIWGSGGPPGGMMYGRSNVGSGPWHIYVYGGAGPVAARVSNLTAAQEQVEIWLSVGYTNTPTWDGMSYCVAQIVAVPDLNQLEMSAAGLGIGFCGAQFVSNGTFIKFTGSSDMGATCLAEETLCANATDLTQVNETNCDGLSFSLPALGRKSAASANAMMNGQPHGASAYPATANVRLDGTASDAIHFGPTASLTGL